MIKETPKILVLSIIGFFAVVAYSVYVVTRMDCSDEPVGKYLSPSSDHTIEYYIRDCGATTGFVDHVEIDGNLILIGEAKDGEIPALKIKWVDTKKILVQVSTTTKDLRIYKKPIESYQDINILYDQKIIDSYQKWMTEVR